MNPAISRLQNWPLALAMLGGVGLVISFLAPVFTTNVRWALILSVLVFTVRMTSSLGWLRSPTGKFLVGYIAWAFLTYFWSMQPVLSAMKAAAFALVVVGLVSAGYRWVRVNNLRHVLSFLFPLMVVAILAGVLGRTEGAAYSAGSGMDLYRGLVDNPNMFGSLMFMVSPLLVWNIHCSRGLSRERMLWGLLLALVFAFLLLSVSRSSILAFLLMVGAYGMALPLARRTSILFFGGLAIATTLLMWPRSLDYVESRYVHKNMATQGASVFFSRQTPWEISLSMAKQGGWFGAGYGVSIDGGSFKGGLTAVGYGREKGNTQLAIVEEAGLVGLALHAVIVISLVGRLRRASRAAKDPNLKIVLYIVLGALVGELAAGVFEAWWVAPGAPESIWFWTMVGVALGLSEVADRKSAQQARMPARVTVGQVRSRFERPSRKTK